MWQNAMANVGTEVDEVFVQIASELLGRQFILYPVIPRQGNEDRVFISPSTQTNHEPYHILLYEDHNFNTPHYQSLRPRIVQSFIETPENSQVLPQEHQSMFSRLSAISNQSLAVNNHIPSERYIIFLLLVSY